MTIYSLEKNAPPRAHWRVVFSEAHGGASVWWWLGRVFPLIGAWLWADQLAAASPFLGDTFAFLFGWLVLEGFVRLLGHLFLQIKALHDHAAAARSAAQHLQP
jgi:hypothetical protein